MDELQKEIILKEIILLSKVLDAYAIIIINKRRLPRELLKDFESDMSEY